ncbi:MAG: cyclase family protein [bacterium]
MTLYDITMPIDDSLPVWPGDPRPTLHGERTEDGVRTSVLTCSAHTGTHIDAPSHGIEGGKNVEEIPLDTLVGPALVIQIANEVKSIGPELLEAYGISERTKRLLLKTSNSRLHARGSAFVEEYVALTPGGARWIRDRGIRLVGIDYLSIQLYDTSGFRTHLTLLEADIVILEGLRLMDVPPGEYELFCLPLKLVGSDGAPVRAILRQSWSSTVHA